VPSFEPYIVVSINVENKVLFKKMNLPKKENFTLESNSLHFTYTGRKPSNKWSFVEYMLRDAELETRSI
jgi:hypothetical protein